MRLCVEVNKIFIARLLLLPGFFQHIIRNFSIDWPEVCNHKTRSKIVNEAVNWCVFIQNTLFIVISCATNGRLFKYQRSFGGVALSPKANLSKPVLNERKKTGDIVIVSQSANDYCSNSNTNFHRWCPIATQCLLVFTLGIISQFRRCSKVNFSYPIQHTCHFSHWADPYRHAKVDDAHTTSRRWGRTKGCTTSNLKGKESLIRRRTGGRRTQNHSSRCAKASRVLLFSTVSFKNINSPSLRYFYMYSIN